MPVPMSPADPPTHDANPSGSQMSLAQTATVAATHCADDVRHEPARFSARAWLLLLALTAIFTAFDLWTKAYAFHHVAADPVLLTREDVVAAERLSTLIPMHDPVVVVPSVLELTLVLNPGAVFGLGAGMRWAFVGFTLFAAGFAVWLFGWWTRHGDWLTHTGFALLIGGGLGNLYDRIVYACVRDFLHPLPGVPLPFGLTWPGGSPDMWPYVSNVADAFLLIGIGILLVYFWRDHSAEAGSTPEQAAT